MANSVPIGSKIVITFPNTWKVNDASFNVPNYRCILYCVTGSNILTNRDTATNSLSIDNAFATTFERAPGPLTFELEGMTNPPTTD